MKAPIPFLDTAAIRLKSGGKVFAEELLFFAIEINFQRVASRTGGRCILSTGF
jgi:hypothetical protein